ncbi:MAG: T9SS type A sorting domain-containing protein [Sphingobacteriales bacterium]|nr:MAG: T9SS type A sorting domain-containing protein [Sphingobacteriales bacterium]
MKISEKSPSYSDNICTSANPFLHYLSISITKVLAGGKLLFLFFSLFFTHAPSSTAQTTIATTAYTGNGSGAGSVGTGITFSITNNNGGGIILQEVGYSPGSTNQTQLWYSATSLTGTANIATPTWTQLATVSSPTTVGTTVINNSFFTGLSLVIPGGTTYRFCVVVVPSTARYHNPGGVTPSSTVFSSGGVDLVTTSSLWGSQSSVGNTGRYYFGSITFIPAGPPCPAPGPISVSNKTSTSARLSWPAVAGSTGYEYHVTTAATPPATGQLTTTSTQVNPSALTPATNYNLFVRNKCNPPNQATSSWVNQPFTTNPPCSKRIIKFTEITATSAKIRWNGEGHATQYEYMLKQDTSMPVTGTTSITDTAVEIKTLLEGTKYYFFVRMVCGGGELSPWVLDSFTTRIVCRPPDLKVQNLNHERAVIYWDRVPSAVAYQYEVSQSPTPLGKGTRILTNSFLAFPLRDNEVYYFHVKSECSDQGFDSESDWTTTSFKTWPTSVASTTADPFMITAFPNPAKDQLIVRILGNLHGEARLELGDVNGKVVENVVIKNNNTILDLRKITPGIYLLKYADAQHIETIRIVKQ